MEEENVAGPSSQKKPRKQVPGSDLNRPERRQVAKDAKTIVHELTADNVNVQSNSNPSFSVSSDDSVEINFSTNFNSSVISECLDDISSEIYESDVHSNSSSLFDGNSEISDCSSDPTVPVPFLKDELIFWAKKHNITNNATTDLLHVLKPFFPDLPLDSRTLLSTPREIDVKSCSGGSFVYFGIEKMFYFKLQKVLMKIPQDTL